MKGPILLCAATRVEASACEMGLSRSGNAVRFEVLRTGMGPLQATRSLGLRLADERRPQPELIISTGFAGSRLTESVEGAWLLGSSVHADGEPAISISSRLTHVLGLSGLEHALADYFSVSEVLGPQTEKSLHGFAIDMESFSLAQIARKRGIPFEIFRLISDTPSNPIPECVREFAAVATSQSARGKLDSALRGLSALAESPVELSRFVLRSSRLPRALESGWERLARNLVFAA